MGIAVGQVPGTIKMVTLWCKAHTGMPVIVKQAPDITDIRLPARAALRGGAVAARRFNTAASITAVNRDSSRPQPMIAGRGSHGGCCGPAVKPVALNIVAEIARDAETHGAPIGGVTAWRMRPGSSRRVQVGCRSAPSP